MTKGDLEYFKRWFSDYCRSFYSPEIEDQKNIFLKEKHTANVCENIVEISRRLALDEDRTLLAETIALFHDIGRFPQYVKYKTFRDSVSVNHGYLGAETLRETNITNILSPEEQKIVVRAVRFHNAFSIPEKEREDIVFFIKLIRDADKLDIWRVFLEHYEGTEEGRASAVGLGLPETPECSDDVLKSLFDGRIVSLSSIKTLNDFKLLQLSWIYDLNFIPSLAMTAERGYIEKIASHLPETEATRRLSRLLNEFVEAKLNFGK